MDRELRAYRTMGEDGLRGVCHGREFSCVLLCARAQACRTCGCEARGR